jgi:thiopeptide-type bacteriocin biosynthesis protein
MGRARKLSRFSRHDQGWLSYYIPVDGNSWRRVLRAVRAASHEALAEGLASKWFYVFLDEGQGTMLRWRIQVSSARRHAFLRSVRPRVLIRRPVSYVAETERYGGRQALVHCESIFWISSEIASEVLEIRKWSYPSRLVLAIILQRFMLGELARGLALRQPPVLETVRESWLRREAKTDLKRLDYLTQRIRRLAQEGFHLGPLIAFEKDLMTALQPKPRQFLAAAIQLKRVRRHLHPRFRSDDETDQEWSARIVQSLIHMLNNRLRIRNLDESLIAEAMLLLSDRSRKRAKKHRVISK